jgi:ABC-type Fe3+-siderophore transport system permease subunit
MGNRNLLQVKMALFFGFGLIVLGAFLPWSKNGPFTDEGIEGDGIVTLLLAAIGAAVAQFDSRPRGMLIAVSLAALILSIAIANIIDVNSQDSGGVSIGLYLTIAASVLATAASGLLAFNLFKKPEVPEESSEPPPPPSPRGPTTSG